jgi:hypothetical protein
MRARPEALADPVGYIRHDVVRISHRADVYG